MTILRKKSAAPASRASGLVSSLGRAIESRLPTLDRRSFLKRSGLGVGAGIAAGQLSFVRKAQAKPAGSEKLDGKGNARVALKVPDFNGTLRVSALVYSDTRYGNRDRETVVRAPIVAEASLPRVLSMLEMFTGVGYLATVVSRLISLTALRHERG